MTAEIGDIVVLSNGLNLKLVLEDAENYFKTIDVISGKKVTTGINIKKLDQFSVGLLTWGYGSEEHKIVKIIKNDVDVEIKTMEIFNIEKHWDDFKQGKLAVNCRTEDSANEFLKYCHNKGLKWGSGASLLELNYWHNYESKMCYSHHNGMTKENVDYYQKEEYIITEFNGLNINYIGKRVKIINLDGIADNNMYFKINEYIDSTGKIIKDYKSGRRFVLKYDDKLLQMIDQSNGNLCFKIENIEILEDVLILVDKVKCPKPPLGVTPKQIFELQRVQELCRALYERSIFEEVDYNLMIKWSEELNDRLYGLKGDKEFDLLGNI